MARIKIKQLDLRTATAGISLGGDRRRRKLQPGEVVDIPDSMMADNGKEGLLDTLYATNKIELTPESITRPLEFETEREAQLTAPTFKPRGPDEAKERDEAISRVAARVEAINSAPRAHSAAESPADEPSSDTDSPRGRRMRRAARALDDQQIPTG